ncbi:hypothetical protein SRHO_G00208280 [Serrasalmus rhombeus]
MSLNEHLWDMMERPSTYKYHKAVDRSSQLRVRQLAGDNGKGNTAERLGSIVLLKAGNREMEHICLPHFNGKDGWEFYSKQLSPGVTTR